MRAALCTEYRLVQVSRLTLGLAIVFTVYGGILRLNALSSRYGPVDRPAWAHVMTTRVAPLARFLQPRIYAWPPIASPYVGGDPVNYLRFGREMQSFYQAHVREPVFLATVRVFLVLLQNQDIAVSFASAAMSTLCILGTYLLGARAFGAPVGLLAALGWAIDYDAITWAPDGWRDDTFTCVLVFATWAFVRLWQDRRPANAVLAGVLAAVACLTRITSVSFVCPALAAILLARRGDWRGQFRLVGLASAVTVLLVAPYLINCWRATGDPFIAINAHTSYYRAHEGIDFSKRMNALAYVAQKLTRKPVYQLDTTITGFFVFPMRNKWFGFDFWVPYLSTVLMWLSIAGLFLCLGHSTGRLLLLIAFTALIPYAFTWNVGAGGEWRFTMHVYPLFLIAASYAVVWLARGLWRIPRALPQWSPSWWTAARAAGVVLIVLVASVGYVSLPYFVVRESLQYGVTTSINTGERDWVFYTRGWSKPRTHGAVTARVMIGEQGTIRFPIPVMRTYRLTLRADPATPELPRRVVLFLNGRILFPFGLGFDPTRVGSYSVDVSPDRLRSGANELTLIADKAIPAETAGDRYAWLPASTPVSLRVWYIRLDPL
jgi:hypothetical protein